MMARDVQVESTECGGGSQGAGVGVSEAVSSRWVIRIFFGLASFGNPQVEMEQDRQQADLSTPEINGESVPVSKQPKKRFIGRRAAAERAAAKGEANGGIEDSGAIQGVI